MVEELFGLLCYCESGINQYAVPKTITDVFGGRRGSYYGVRNQ